MIDFKLRSDIRLAESCKLLAYKDTKGVWTIGWGHALEDGKDHTGLVWTQAMADTILDSDIFHAQRQAATLPEWASLDTPCRQNAVTELVFNMGLGDWIEFHATRNAIQVKAWLIAHDQLLASKWAGEVHAERADRLANYLRDGQYPTQNPV